MADLFSMASRALPSTARVLAFRGTEALSAIYEIQIHLLIDDPAFDMAAALGADATLSLDREDGPPHLFHGILATIETVDDLARGTVYRALLVPRIFRLTLTRHSRVFVKQSAPAILEEILRGAGMTGEDYELKLAGAYAPLDHVCQYRESDYAFLSRRMEREGIYSFFEQGETRERLIITDDRSFHRALAGRPVRYSRVSGAGAAGVEGLRSFTCKHASIPGSVQVKDHDYLRPALDVSGAAPASNRTEEIHLYGENFTTPDEGRRLARVRAEELKARQVVFRGAGNAYFLRPGYTFALSEHPRFDGGYLVTELAHAGNQLAGLGEAKDLLGLDEEQDEVYRVDVTAVPEGVQFRPERRTPVPRIYGMERALIDGEADHDYAQLDEHGRYLVKIHFDESPAKDGKASARIRMMQPHGGNPESFHFPLRKGTEVMLAFEGGDPDRPVIVGAVPTLLNPTGVTSKNPTKNVLMTGGGNRLVIEDEKDKEYIHLSTPNKKTFLHMGSTFNPQYNKISYTKGDSLSFASGVSTSYTGFDAQTLVDLNRITVIGRGSPTLGASSPGTITAAEIAAHGGTTPQQAQLSTGGQGMVSQFLGSGFLPPSASATAPLDAGENAAWTPNSGITTGDTPGYVVLPDPNIGSTFIDISMSDGTGNASGPLHPGSDIKIVGGDDVKHVCQDARVTVEGNSFSKIHGKQTSLVENDVDQTINGNKTLTVNGNATTHLNGWVHNTTVFGNRFTELFGTDTYVAAAIKTQIVGGISISALLGGEFKFVLAPGLKLTVAQATELNPTQSLSVKLSHIKETMSSIESHVSAVATRVTYAENNITFLQEDVSHIEQYSIGVRIAQALHLFQ